MIILGIDPGLADTGFGVVEEDDRGDLKEIVHGSIQTDPGLPLPDRLEIVGDELACLIKEYCPSLIAVEQLFFCKNVKTALLVGQARGVVLYISKKSGLELLEFTPLQIKQAVTSYGKAPKMQVQKMVQLLLGMKELPKPDDAADALAVAICAATSHRSKKGKFI